MKISRIMRFSGLFAATALGLTGAANAVNVYHVHGSLYVIECESDGSAFTFNGTSAGSQEVGAYLCPNGVVAPDNPNGEPVVTIETKPVPRDIQKKLRANDAQGSESSAYIHRPDSTQYHPGGGTAVEHEAVDAVPAGTKAGYIHRPDSTQYHPGTATKAPVSTK